MRLRRWSHGSPKQFQDGGGRHLEFRKNVNNFGLDKYLASNYMGRCTTATRRCPRDQKSKPEVNSRDVIKLRSEAYVRRSQ